MQDITNRNMASLFTNNATGGTVAISQACKNQQNKQAALQQTNESKLRSHLKKMELLLDNASNQLRQDNQSSKQQTIFTTVSSALTTSNPSPHLPSNNNLLHDTNTLQKQQLKEKTTRDATLEDIDTLKSVLSCPIFNRLIDIQDSLDRLSQQMQLHPSISLADFDIDENSGELILAPPIENQDFSNGVNANVATTIISDNNIPASMLHQQHHHHQQQQAIYNNCQKQNNFDHQTEILFDEGNIQNNYHLTFNSSEFDAHQHVLNSLQNNLQTQHTDDLINPTYHEHHLDESSLNDHNSVLYSTINHSNGNGKESCANKSTDIADLTNKISQHQLIEHENNIKQNQHAITDAGDNSTLYSAIKINNSSRLQKNIDATDSNQHKKSIVSDQTLDDESINHRRQSNSIATTQLVSDNVPSRQTNVTTNIPPNQVQLTTLDSYSTTTIVTPVAEKLLDGDINLTSRASCSPSTSIGSAVKLVDEGYSGASSLQSNLEKQNTNGGTPSPQTRTLNSSNNNQINPAKTNRSSTFQANVPLEPLSPTKLAPNDSKSSANSLKRMKQLNITDPRETFSSTDKSVERLSVTLEKNERGLGMTVAGFVCKDNQEEAVAGIFIKSIEPNSPAALNGNIRISDQICAVDGIELTGFNNKQAVEVLKKTGKTLTLELLRVEHVAQPIGYTNPRSCLNPQSTKLSGLINHQILKSDKFPSEANSPLDQPRLQKNNKPIPAPKPSSIVISSNTNHTITNSNRAMEGVQNSRQQISARKGPAPQPPLHKAGSMTANSDDIDCTTPTRRQSSDNNIIESISGSRNKVNIQAKTNTMMKTRAEVTIDVKNPTMQQPIQTHKTGTFSSPPLNPIQMEPDGSGSLVNLTNQDRNITDNKINCDSITNSSSNENDCNLLNSSADIILDNSYSNFISKTDTLPMWDEKSKAQIIQLNKGSQKGLGFSVLDYHNPADTKQTVIVIRSLVPGGIADLDGRLVPGDRLLFVDDKDLRDATLEEAVKALKEANGLVSLGILKPIPYYNSNKTEKKHPFT